MTTPPRPEVDTTRAAYDAVAGEYTARLADELDGKPLDRALLAAFAELVGADGVVADVGCGPGHVAEYLRRQGCAMVGIDLSPSMIEIARGRYPGVDFQVGSMLDLAAADDAWAGAVLLYSIIHLSHKQRTQAYGELARVIRPGGLVLISFHVGDAEHAPGEAETVYDFFGQPVELTSHYLAPDDVGAGLAAGGFVEIARLEREPDPAAEYPSRRCYLLARRGGD